MKRRKIASMQRSCWSEMWEDMKPFYTDDVVEYIALWESKK